MARGGVERGRHHLHLALGIEVREDHLRTRLRSDLVERPCGRRPGGRAGGREVGRPGAAAVRRVHPPEEGRDHLAQLRQHEIRARARLGERRRAKAQQEGLVRLARAVESHVRPRRGRKEPAEGVERLRPDGVPVHDVGVRRLTRVAPAEVLLHRLEPPGVGLEHEVERRLEVALERRPADLRRHVVAPAPAGPVRVRDVAGRLLEVGHEAAPLEELREHVGDALAREVDTAQLRDRVVPVLDEDALEEPLRPGRADAPCGRRPLHGRVGELVEEQPAERLGRARVAREQRALHDLGKVDEREDRGVDVREVGSEPGPLLRGERLGRADAQQAALTPGSRACWLTRLS